MIIQKINNPRKYFTENNKDFFEVVEVVRDAFGSEMTEEDIFNHLVEPEKVYLAREGKNIFTMASYNDFKINDKETLFVEGVAISSKMQGNGLFGRITESVLKSKDYELIGLKTQNPRMYNGLIKLCNEVTPISFRLKQEQHSLAKKLNLNINYDGVAKGFYGKSLYGEIFKDTLFDYLEINQNAGDSVVCIGELK